MADEHIVVKEKPNVARRRQAIFFVVLFSLCFVVHYILMRGMCDMSEGQVYPWCVPGRSENYWISTFLVQVGNSGLVFTLLWYFGWPMLQSMVAERKHTIERDIEESGKAKATAEKAYNDVMERTQGISEEKKEIRRSYEEAAKAESARILSDAEEQARRMAEEARAAFDIQVKTAKRKFEEEMIAEAIDRARDEIEARLASDAGLHGRLIDQSIAALDFQPQGGTR